MGKNRIVGLSTYERERGVGNKIAPLQHKFWVKWDMSVNKRNFNALQVLIKLNYAAILLHPSRTSAAFLLLSLSADTELVLWNLCKKCKLTSKITILIWNLDYCEVSGWTIRIYPNILLHVDSRWSTDRQGCRIYNTVVNRRFFENFNFLKEINSSKLLDIFY